MKLHYLHKVNTAEPFRLPIFIFLILQSTSQHLHLIYVFQATKSDSRNFSFQNSASGMTGWPPRGGAQAPLSAPPRLAQPVRFR